MIKHYVWHTLRSKGWPGVLMFGVLLALGVSMGAAGGVVRQPLSLSQLVFFALVVGIEHDPVRRELWLAPISRRQFWLARWWLAVVIPAGATMALALPGALLGGWLAGVDGQAVKTALTLATLMFAYAGTMMALLAAWEWLSAAGWRRLAMVPRWCFAMAVLPVFAGLFLIRDVHITTRMLTTGPVVWFLLGGVALGVAAAFHSPAPGTYETLFAPRAEHASAGRWTRGSGASGPAGLRGLIPSELRSVALTMFATLWAGAGVVVLWNTIAGNPARLPDDALVFSGRIAGGPILLLFPLVVMMLRDGPLASVSTNRLFSLVRQMRLLPMSLGRLVGLLMARRAAGWIAFWCAMLALQLIAVGPPAGLYLGWLLLVIGLDILADSLRFRLSLSTQPALLLAAVVVAGGGWMALGWMDTLAGQVAAPLAGLAAVAAALPLYRHALTRGEWLLRPTGHPVMTPM